MSRRAARRPTGTLADPPRSVRVAEDTWTRAKRRAESSDGVTISYVAQTLLEAYGRGMINLPKVVMTYDGSAGTGAG